jgi:hypothetical protein
MTGSAATGLVTANPAMVASGSYRPSRSKNAASIPIVADQARAREVLGFAARVEPRVGLRQWAASRLTQTDAESAGKH